MLKVFQGINKTWIRNQQKYLSTSTTNLEQIRTNLHRRYETATSLKELTTEDNKLLNPLSKIICTIGPASHSPERIQELVNEGMLVLRINCSHATRQEMEERVKWLRQSDGLHSNSNSNSTNGVNNLRAILFDTKGPEIRTSELPKPLTLTRGESVTLSSFNNNNEQSDIVVTYENIESVVDIGQAILLDDGLIDLTVIGKEKKRLLCEVQNDGSLGDRKGVNIPGANLNLPAMTELDREHLSIAVELDADYVAASFVRTSNDVLQIRSYLQELHEIQRKPDLHPIPKIISKIESAEALQNFDEILRVSDGIMVARGDLAVEIPFSVVTRAQKMIVSKCNLAGKPVVVATQMLENMIENPRPTRAEVSDVVNAVYDGADCVMLSGESAKGKFPIESCQTLARIARQADVSYSEYSNTSLPSKPNKPSMARAVVQAARDEEVDLIICVTSSGKTAEKLSAEKGPVPIMAFVASEKVGRQLNLNRGVWPVFGENLELPVGDESELQYMLRPKQAVRKAKELGLVHSGDTVLIVLSEPSSSDLEQTFSTRTAVVK